MIPKHRSINRLPKNNPLANFMKRFNYIFINSFLLAPAITFAASGTIGDIIQKFQDWAFLIINFLLVLATLVFLWGIIKYVSAGGDAAKVKEARSYILWGIIGLAIMGSVWALATFLRKSFGVEENTNIPKDIYQPGGISL